MRIDLTDADGDKLFAEYGNFSLTNSSDSYRLLLGGYRGSVGKLMYFFKHPNEVGSRHAGQQFTTKDVDRDKWGGNCASYTGGGFWLDECCIACLNGKYRQINGNLCMGSVIGDIVLHCVQRTEMKFRPASAMSLTPGNYTEPPPHSSKQ
ncbi:fibroleukin-like [Liolophura sinensis]|uniref:fibroleukin-like n=1 Tax=Liolophura sinensis TaxID=3198878 RepID=UPI0031597E7B